MTRLFFNADRSFFFMLLPPFLMLRGPDWELGGRGRGEGGEVPNVTHSGHS